MLGDQWILTNADKVSVDATGRNIDAHNPMQFMSLQQAGELAQVNGLECAYVLNGRHNVAVVDIDNCRDPETGSYDERAIRVFEALKGCFVEISRSGRGLHFWGVADPNLSVRFMNRADGIEFYQTGRYIIQGTDGQGDPTFDMTSGLRTILTPRETGAEATLTADGPVPEYTGPADDDHLIQMALQARGSIASLFGKKARFTDLWNGSAKSLANFYPTDSDDPFDRSAAEAALCAHLAFWTGKDHARMQRLLLASPLAQSRPDQKKLQRSDYLARTIHGAATKCHGVYSRPTLPSVERAAPKLPLIRASDWHNTRVPEREWHVEGLIPARNVTLLSGPGGSGKSTLAAQLAVTTALGKGTWVGRPTRTGKVLMLSAEDSADELHRRIAQISSLSFSSLEELHDLQFIDLAEKDATLLMPNASKSLVETPVFNSFEELVQQIQPALILIDTLADTFGGNENDRVQARRYASTMRRLAMKSGAAVVILSHPSLTGMNSGSGLSGSTAWDGSVRSRLYMERVKSGEEEPDPDLRRLSLKKSNYGRLGFEFLLRYRNGVFFPEGDPNADRNTTARAKFLELLDWHIERQIDVGPNQGRNYAPKKFSVHPKAAGFSKTALRTAMNTLLEYGQISTLEIGPPSKRKTVLRRPKPPGVVP